MGIPWWGWLIAAVAAALLLYKLVLMLLSRLFRTVARRYLVNILQLLDPALALEFAGANRLRAKFLGKPIDLDLEPYFALITKSLGVHPIKEQQTVFEFLESSLPELMPILTIERHRSRIRPKLITADDLQRRQQFASLPTTPLGNTGLHVIYVVVGENTPMVFAITTEQMSQLGFSSAAELRQHAVDQLVPHTPREAIDAALRKGEVSALGMHDEYVAARILAVQRMLDPGDSLVALIPDLYSCVLLSVPKDGDWSRIHEGARRRIHDGPMLLDRPVLVTHDAIQVVAPTAEA